MPTCHLIVQQCTMTPLPVRKIMMNNQDAEPFDFSPSTTSPDNTNTSTLRINKHIGTPIPNDKDDSTTRLFFTNPNGLNLGRTGGDFTEYLETAKTRNIDILCLAEINLDTRKHTVQDKMRLAARRQFNHFRLTTGSSTISSQNEFKPGGTLIMTTDSTSARIIETSIDPLGRWTTHTFLGKRGQQIVLICAYQVCQLTNENRGRKQSLTAYAQQRSLLGQDDRGNIEPRKAFMSDLTDFL
mmetsp:Transcript_10291/g.22640  ORF Transcript_10291/g.22640 Transcript_10291/m.22640 type:complete len:241 (+) Transcript_10291:1085-1807(+)